MSRYRRVRYDGGLFFFTVTDYIHYNPVKHGYVSHVQDWSYSSFHRYVEQGLLPPDWGGAAGDLEGEFGE